MFFDEISQVKEIAKRTGTSVFVIPKEMKVKIDGAVTLAPQDKTVITIEQVREMMGALSLKQTTEKFVVIRPADKLGLDAANALLKNLEEPSERIHYLLITENLAQILPTILSRAAIYILRQERAGLEIVADEKNKQLAKKLIVASGAELANLAEEIAKKKTGVREYALEIIALAIEMLTKSYYITGKEIFLKKMPSFLQAYENIAKNGHIKLQIVANLC